ncbi:MAG: hypothetical protein M1156_01350, partial [Candidatus Marsarchaeota archaeon]|nr:hypothetical protein [Candidatus Marsarchaeota archaeon]
MILEVIIGILAIVLPGFFLALALLKKTGMHLASIFIIGIFFGIIFPPAMIWIESYLIPFIHAFTFSAGLYNINVVILTVLGIILSYWQGALTVDLIPSALRSRKAPTLSTINADYKQRIAELRSKTTHLGTDMKLMRDHEREEQELSRSHQNEISMLKQRGAGEEEISSVIKQHENQERRLYEDHEREEQSLISKEDVKKGTFPVVWTLLLLLMIITFASRIANIGVAPKFFEFDPYFDMMATQQILTYGYQLFTTHAAWPTLVNGTIQRIQPAVPYLEAYWYQLANPSSTSTINLASLSTVSSVYPPLLAALLVFVVFLFVYQLYGDFPALVAAGLAAAMPALLTSYIAGEQLLEPWGITAMFFFFATYLLAVKNPKEKRYAVLAGIAFVSNFLGAHYYTVTTGLLAVYIVLQGVINILRRKDMMDFYKMNAIVLIVIIIGYAAYGPYNAVYGGGVPSMLGIPTIVAFPLFALILVVLFEYIPILAKKYNILKGITKLTYYEWLAALAIIIILLLVFTPLGNPVKKYIALSERFTTPSSPLFMTVQEYAPTGITYDFGSSSAFGVIGGDIAGFPVLMWIALIAFVCIELYNIIRKDSNTSILSISILVVLAAAGMSEVKYMPHFGVAYIIVVAIIIGEAALYIKRLAPGKNGTLTSVSAIIFIIILAEMALTSQVYSAVITAAALAILLLLYFSSAKNPTEAYAMRILFLFGAYIFMMESLSIISVFAAASNPNCSAIANSTNIYGYTMFCNQVPQAWLSAMAWAAKNIGPNAPRILA